MVTVNGYITTPVFGGQEGELFNDVFCSTKDTGAFLVKDSGVMKAIKMNYPIATIQVFVDIFIRGMTVSYRVAGSQYETVEFERGNETLKQSRLDLRGSEVLLAVFGRAGPLSRHDPRQVIHSIGFVLFDSVTGIIRVHGPHGNTTNAMGEPFHVTNVVGFGGFHNQESDIGLSGLFFIKDMNML